MSDVIQLLPDHVANQIAAGEVVQRPASIVKELMENAVDAGAKKVELIIREAGKNLVQVTDDGTGMSDTDARLAFERHATSKIKTSDDLFRIHSKGFRGEALASIAAVAQVELKTKTEAASVGTNLYIEGGNLQFQEPTQTQIGSNILVKNLFFNVPARRKFLKNNNIEFRHILDEFQRLALTHFDTEFDLFHNDEPIYRLRKTNLLQRILDLFGRKLQPLLLPIQEDLDWVRLHGYVGKPEAAKKTRGEQFFFVNNRFFRNPYFNRAVNDSFEGLLLPGYSPSFFLLIEIDPEKIDVNIHPQKTEVKFEDDHLIYALLRSTIKKTLGIYNVAPSLDFDRNPSLENLMNTGTSSSFGKDSFRPNRNFNPFKEDPVVKSSEINGLNEFYTPEFTSEPSKINLFDEDLTEGDLIRLPNGYWLYNKGEDVLVLDLSRMYSVLLHEQYKHNPIPTNSQILLFSVEYHLNEFEKNQLKSITNQLESLGFAFRVSKDNILLIDAIPAVLNETEVLPFFEQLFQAMEERLEEDFMSFYQVFLVKFHSNAKADFFSRHKAEEIIRQYHEIGFPKYTANAKLCFTELALDEIKSKF